MKKRKPIKRNPAARVLGDPRFRGRVVKVKKGKGAYRRRPKHRGGRSDVRGTLA